MRTARYVIRIKDDTPSWCKQDTDTRNKQFSLLTDTCRSLEKDGFSYDVAIASKGAHLTFTITGSAGPATKVKASARKSFHLPAKITAEQCRKRAIVAQKEINSAESSHARTLKFDSPQWRTFDGFLKSAVTDGGFEGDETLRENLAAAWCDVANPELGYHAGILRSILNQNLNYILWELHYAADSPYRAMSGLCNPGDYFRHASPNIDCARKWYARDTRIQDAEKSAARDFMAQLPELRQAETEFWTELELLTGQRDHFRPGSPDTLSTDDTPEFLEVAA